MKIINCYFCTNLQQLSNCWPAIALRIQVTVMLLKGRYTLLRNFTMMTFITLESNNQCTFIRPVAWLYSFTLMILRSLKSTSLPNNYVLFVFDFYFRRFFHVLTSRTKLAPSNLQGVVLCGAFNKGDGSLTRSLLIVIGVRARFIASFFVVCTMEYSCEL